MLSGGCRELVSCNPKACSSSSAGPLHSWINRAAVAGGRLHHGPADVLDLKLADAEELSGALEVLNDAVCHCPWWAADNIWATDITTIPLQKGFFYLVAIVDLFSKRAQLEAQGNLDMEFCLDALEMALAGVHKPEIFYSIRAANSPSDFVQRLQAKKIKVRKEALLRKHLIEGCGARKYEEVYLLAYIDGCEPEISLARFIWRYCHVRPHSSLGGKTTHEIYIEIETCFSLPEFTMSEPRTPQQPLTE